jgi:hypothetical protein
MTKKERALKAMRFKEIDRIPTMYRGLPYLSKSLMKYFNIGNQNDPILLLKHYKDLLEALEADFWTLGGGGYFSTFTPKYIGPDIDYIDPNYYATLGIKTGIKTIDTYDFSYLSILENPLAGYESHEKVAGYLTKRLDLFDYKNSVNLQINTGRHSSYFNNSIAKELLDYKNFRNSEEDFICMGISHTSPFITCCYLRGMENFLTDIYLNKKMAEAIVNEVIEFFLEFNKRSIEQTCIRPEIYVTWDDVCMQNGSMISPDIYKRYFFSFWKKFISMVRSKDMLFNWHCCGNVNDILPMMIEAGIDCFDVLQTSAKDMEIEKFFNKFGRDICSHGGIDVQQLLILGKPKDIRKEVKKIEELWGTSGGMILGPSHEALPETPIDNILAIYKDF